MFSRNVILPILRREAHRFRYSCRNIVGGRDLSFCYRVSSQLTLVRTIAKSELQARLQEIHVARLKTGDAKEAALRDVCVVCERAQAASRGLPRRVRWKWSWESAITHTEAAIDWKKSFVRDTFDTTCVANWRLRQAVRRVRTCQSQDADGKASTALYNAVTVPKAAFQQVGIDLIALPETAEGFKYVVVLADYFTKYPRRWR